MSYKIGGCFLFFFAMAMKMYGQEADNGEQAKQKVTLSGTIANESSSETLIGATIVIPEANIALLTNAYGFYSITLPQGDYTIAVTSASISRLSSYGTL